MPTQTELADWRRFCDAVAAGNHPVMFSARGDTGATPHPRDAAVLYALRERVYQAITEAAALGVDRSRLTVEVPASYWLRPQSLNGAELFSVPVHLSGEVAWPVLRLELARG